MVLLIEEISATGSLLAPDIAYRTISCIPESRYFGVRFSTGILPSRHFSTEYFRFLDGKTWGSAGVKAPYMLDIRNAGAVGIISDDNLYAHDFIKHTILDLA